MIMNLPMGLYKLVHYDRWDDTWNGDNDYSNYGIHKIYFYQDIQLDRPIVSPAGLANKIISDIGNPELTYQCDKGDFSIRIITGFFRWYDDYGYHTPRAWDIAREEGLPGWDWYELS